MDLEFDKPFKSHNTIEFFLTPEGPAPIGVRWVMTGHKTLATKVMGLFTSMDKMVGDLREGPGPAQGRGRDPQWVTMAGP